MNSVPEGYTPKPGDLLLTPETWAQDKGAKLCLVVDTASQHLMLLPGEDMDILLHFPDGRHIWVPKWHWQSCTVVFRARAENQQLE